MWILYLCTIPFAWALLACGMYAYKSEPSQGVYADMVFGHTYVTGSCWLYGDVVEHEGGYRASHALVRTLDHITNGDIDLLEKLRKRYIP